MNSHNILELIDASKIIAGRPDCYPAPSEVNQAFFIQRNHNQNAVVYIFNFNSDGLINLEVPLSVYWIKYTNSFPNEEPIVEKLNPIQRSLAYGYEHKVISSNLIKFNFVCHKMPFFIIKDNNNYKVITSFEDKNHVLNSIYVHADEFGAFPLVLFANFFVTSVDDGQQSIKTISFG
jgi:hypothetical protein